MVVKTCRLLILFAFSLLVGHTIAHQSEQVPLRLERRRLITKDFSNHVRKLLDEGNVKGLSLAVVKSNEDATGDVELGSWGVKTEDGDSVDSKVSSVMKLQYINLTDSSYQDIVQHRLLHQSFHGYFSRHSHGRLCDREERHASTFWSYGV